jgi:Sulfotransferase family
MPLRFRHIFLITYGRSGSTLLNGILNSIPGICMRGENFNTLAHLGRAVETATETAENALDPDVPALPFYGATLVDPEGFRRKLVAAFVDHILRPPSDAVAIGLKEIRCDVTEMSEAEYIRYIAFLFKSFERCCILFNSRKWIDVAQSGWWPEDPLAVEHLRESEERFRRTMRLHPDSTFWVEYDRYIRDPDALRGLYAFLGAEFDRAAIEQVLQVPHSPTSIIRFRNPGA